MFDYSPPSYGLHFDDATHYLYLGLIILTFLLCNKKVERSDTIPVLFKISFIILWVFAVTRDNVGADYESYYNIFNDALDGSYSSRSLTIEHGFFYLNVILKSICSFEYFGFMAFYFILLYFTYKTITYFKGNISYAFAIMAYITMWYYLSFDVLRICIAASIVGYATRFLLEKRYAIYFIIVILMFNIHMSSIVMILPAIVYLIYLRSTKTAYLVLVLALIILNSAGIYLPQCIFHAGVFQSGGYDLLLGQTCR